MGKMFAFWIKLRTKRSGNFEKGKTIIIEAIKVCNENFSCTCIKISQKVFHFEGSLAFSSKISCFHIHAK